MSGLIWVWLSRAIGRWLTVARDIFTFIRVRTTKSAEAFGFATVALASSPWPSSCIDHSYRFKFHLDCTGWIE